MRPMLSLIAVVSALAAVCSSGGASAQNIDRDYVRPGFGYGPSGYYSGEAYYRPRTRVYGYARYYDGREDTTPRGADAESTRTNGGCGTYRFWNGDRCVDSRYR